MKHQLDATLCRVTLHTLYLYSYSQHGSIYSGVYSCSLGYVREFLLLFLH